MKSFYVLRNRLMYESEELLLLCSNSNCIIKEIEENNIKAVFKFYCKNKQYYGAITKSLKIYIRKSKQSIEKLIHSFDK